MRLLRMFIGFLIVLLGVSFAVLNSQKVLVSYYIGSNMLPLSWLLVLVFVLGNLLGIGVSFWGLCKLKLKNYNLTQSLILAEKEIENLRAIPLRDKS